MTHDKQYETNEAASPEWNPQSSKEQLVMSNTQPSGEGFPLTSRLRLDRSLIQQFPVARKAEHDGHQITHTLRHEPSGETAQNIEYTATKYGGPRPDNATYFGTLESSEPAPKGTYEVLYVGNPWWWVIILGAAAICAGVIAIGAVIHDCASQCRQTCGGRVKRCVADITYGIDFENGQFELGYEHSCEVTCR